MTDRYRGRGDYDRDEERGFGGSGRSGYGRRDWGSDYGQSFGRDDDYERGYSGSEVRTPDFAREGYGSSTSYGDRDAGEYSGRESIRGYDRGRAGAYGIGNERSDRHGYGGSPSGPDDYDSFRDQYNPAERGFSGGYGSARRDYGVRNTGRGLGRDDEGFDNRGRVGVPGYGTAYGGWSGDYDVSGTSAGGFSGTTGRDLGTSRAYGRGPTGNTGTRSGMMSGGQYDTSSRYSEMSGSALGSGLAESRGYRGVGPKNFTRSDDRIRELVSERLEESDDVNAADIEVQVKDGEVTLTGSVDTRHMKRVAEDIAESIPGVRDVNNDLKVNRGLMSRMADGLRHAVGMTESDETSPGSTTSGMTRNTTTGSTSGGARNRR